MTRALGRFLRTMADRLDPPTVPRHPEPQRPTHSAPMSFADVDPEGVEQARAFVDHLERLVQGLGQGRNVEARTH